MPLWKQFWRNQDAQDLIEYTLLIAFVSLAAAAIFMGAGGSISTIWATTNTQLENAAGAGP